MKNLFFTTLVVFLLSACSKSLEGTYADDSGIMEYVFESNGKVYVGAMGISTELEYEIDGDKLKIFHPSGQNQILTLHEDGSITGLGRSKLTKK